MTLAHQFERIVEGGTRHRPHRHRRPHRDRLHARRTGAPNTLHAVEHGRVSAATGRHETVAPRRGDRRHPGSGAAMSDSYYELVDAADDTRREVRRDRHGAQHVVGRDPARRAGVGAVGARAGTLRAARRHPVEPGDDRPAGAVPAEGDLWVRSRIERSGKQIELVSAEMLAAGPDGEPRPVAGPAGGGCRRSTPRKSSMRRRRPCARCPRPTAAT